MTLVVNGNTWESDNIQPSPVTSAVPTGKPLAHGQHSGSLAAVIVLQLTGIVYD